MANYWEVHGWPRVLYTLKGAAVERKVWCEWGDRLIVAAALDTYPNNIEPYYNTGAMLNRMRIDVPKNSQHASTGTKGMISYDHAIITCNYSTQGPSTADLISESLSVAQSGTKWTHAGLYWDTSGANPLQENEAPIKLEPSATYTLHYHRIAAIPSIVYTLPGSINSNTYFTKILGTYINPFHLLYCGADVDRTVTAGGVTMFSVKHKMSYTYNGGLGWAGVYNRNTRQYQYVYNSEGEQRIPYPATAFPT